MNPLLYQTAIELQALGIPALYEHNADQRYPSFLLQYKDLPAIRVLIKTDESYDVKAGMFRYLLQSIFRDRWNQNYWEYDAPAINISASKPAKMIAAELGRRLINSENLEKTRTVIANLKKREKRIQQKMEMFNKATALIGSNQTITKPDQTSRTIFSTKLPVDIAGISQHHEEGKIRLELRGITIEQLRAVCEALSA